MNPFKGLKNLLHALPKGGPHDQPIIRLEIADDQMKVDMIWDLLAEQIGERRNQQIPKPRPNPDDLFRPTLIGAWAEERLVAGYHVLPPLVTLVVQAVYQGRIVTNIGLPFNASQPSSRWAWGLTGHVDGLTVRIRSGGIAEG